MTVPSVDQIAARWSAHAERYHRWGDLAHGHPAYRSAWVDALAGLVGHPCRDGSSPLRIADIGTGTAEIALLLAEMGHDVTGYDIAPGMLGLGLGRKRTRRGFHRLESPCGSNTETPTTCRSPTPPSTP